MLTPPHRVNTPPKRDGHHSLRNAGIPLDLQKHLDEVHEPCEFSQCSSFTRDETGWYISPVRAQLGKSQKGVIFSIKAASSNTSLIKLSDFDKPALLAASWKVEYLVPLNVNLSSYEAAPFFSRNDSSPSNGCDIFLEELAITIWNRFLETGSAGRRPRQGRRRAKTPNEDRYLVLTARRDRNMNATLLQQHLRSATGSTISTQSVRNRLHGVGLYARRPMVCIRLTSRHRRDRRSGQQSM
ncbi:transposable element Tcb2 transposase [Trichonephila clavipes]|nr:transposable element Tcb2 transposase [Trichonephila clavipes]